MGADVQQGKAGSGEPHPLAVKLGMFARLSDADTHALKQAVARSIRRIEAHRDIIREGDNPTAVHVMKTGWAARYTSLSDGRRQISSFIIPGDVFDLNMYILSEMDDSIVALTEVELAEIPRREMEALTREHPAILEALLWQELVTMAVQRGWIVNIGQRSSKERIAHLICEMFLRLERVGLTHDDGFHFPPTQHDLADATGMTDVHVSRILRQLRDERLLELSGREIRIPSFRALKDAAGFRPNYLHLNG